MNTVENWSLTLSTPMGPQNAKLRIVRDDAGFSGRIEAPMGNMDVVGKISGNQFSWVMNVKKPIPIKVTFEATVKDDAMTGIAKMGFFGKAELTGERMSAEAIFVDPVAEQTSVEDLLTEDFIDPIFNEPYVEVDEFRTDPVTHRYVQGGFKGTDARFSFYFPPEKQYQGRFFHNTYPLANSSDIGPFPIAFDVAVGNLGFTIDSGAYYVQTNLGGKDRQPPADPAIAAYRVNAAAAKYSRLIAAKLYGDHRPYGYLFGGSGGSYQVIGSAENTAGIWDGFVPYVIGSPNSIPSMFTIRMHALRVLKQRDRFPGIMDAINPGGSGDPYANLNEEESAALREATLLGFPPRGWWNHATLTSGYFSNVAAIVPMLDPTYVDDFWSCPGYLGTNPKSAIGKLRAQFETTVAEVLPSFPSEIRLESAPEKDFTDAQLIVLSGTAAGKSVPLSAAKGDVVSFAYAADPTVGSELQPGDKVRLDNSWALALQTYQRHQVPSPDLYGWNQYRDNEGNPIYPQREALTGPIGAGATAGSVPEGCINGKMLVVEAMMDVDALPWQADWYRSQVKEKLGKNFEDNFALWYIDHAQHDNPPAGAAQAHTVSFEGALQQALRDLSAWVEKGIRPANTRYEVVNTQVELPINAQQRGGIQPVVNLRANGNIRAEVSVGETVTFNATIEVPSNSGSAVTAEWDFEGLGNYPVATKIETPQSRLQLETIHAYQNPGTYFAVLRATSQREGDKRTPYGRIQNIARVRIVVHKAIHPLEETSILH